MEQRTITITNRLGLHARAAAKVVKLAVGFRSDILLVRFDSQHKRADAKSILGILLLAASQGTVIEIIADGEDEVEAMESLSKLIENKFGEE